jgi:hypothetical protein
MGIGSGVRGTRQAPSGRWKIATNTRKTLHKIKIADSTILGVVNGFENHVKRRLKIRFCKIVIQIFECPASETAIWKQRTG